MRVLRNNLCDVMPSLKPGTNVEADTSISKGASFIQTHTEEQEVEVSMAASRWC